MKKFRTIILSIAMLLGTVALPVQTVGAVNVFKDSCSAGDTSEICKEAGDVDKGNELIKTVVNLLLYAIGIISVIVIIIGGIRYTTSGGDANGIKSAKDTILYAVVGLIVAMLAYAIVNFVVGWFI